MDQYNRLLDIFNSGDPSSKESKSDLLKQLSSQEPLDKKVQQMLDKYGHQLTPEQQAQLFKKQQSTPNLKPPNRAMSGSRQSIASLYTTASNLPVSGTDVVGSAHDLMRLQNEYDEELKSFSTVHQNTSYLAANKNDGRQTTSAIDERNVDPNGNLIQHSSSLVHSDPNLYQSNEITILFSHVFFVKYLFFSSDEDNSDDTENVNTYYSNRNQGLTMNGNNKRNNKVLSKISASSNRQQNDGDKDFKYDKTGTNLLVNNQLDRNNRVVDGENSDQVGTAAMIGAHDESQPHKTRNNNAGHGQTYTSTAHTTIRPGGSQIANAEFQSSQGRSNIERVTVETQTVLSANRGLLDESNDLPYTREESVQERSRHHRSHHRGKKLAALHNEMQKNYQTAHSKSSAFSLTIAKKDSFSQSSNENIDNGYYTMTHTTPYQHLMEEEASNEQLAHHKSGHYKSESKKLPSYEQQHGSKQQKQQSEILNDSTENYDESLSRTSPYTKTRSELDSGIGSMSANKAKKKMNAAKEREAAAAAGKRGQEMKHLSAAAHRREEELDRRNGVQQLDGQPNGYRGPGGLPRAKAYEGSDSGEEIDTLTDSNNRKHELASANRSNRMPLETRKNANSLVRGYAPKYSASDDERIRNYHDDDYDYEEQIDDDGRYQRNYKRDRDGRTPKMRESKRLMQNGVNGNNRNEIIENQELDETNTDASSVIYREKPQKTSKRFVK